MTNVTRVTKNVAQLLPAPLSPCLPSAFIWCSVAWGLSGVTLDLIRFVFTLSPCQQGHMICPAPVTLTQDGDGEGEKPGMVFWFDAISKWNRRVMFTWRRTRSRVKRHESEKAKYQHKSHGKKYCSHSLLQYLHSCQTEAGVGKILE